MARNDYMREPVTMKALQNWTGAEGKIKRGQIITVSESRARELEGRYRPSGRTITIDGSEAGDAHFRGRARAVRVDGKATTKGGPTADDRKGQHDKPEPVAPEAQDEPPMGEQGDEPPGGESEPNATGGAMEAAEQYGVSLADVPGTGANGRVTKPDVEAYVAEQEG